MKQKVNLLKITISSVGLNLFQIAAIAGLVVYAFIGKGSMAKGYAENEFVIFMVLALAALLNIFFSVRNRRRLSADQKRNSMLQEALSRLESLNNTLRGQRHDFLNHLQVVYSLMEMEEYTEARDYIDKVYKDILKVSRVLKTSNPAVNALLQAKLLDCEKRGIDMSINVSSPYKDLKIPSWEMCRVLGNIIDNGADALSSVENGRKLNVELFEDIKSHGFRISNNGPMIPENLLEKIFEPGFTTKGGKDEGMGLAIVRETLSEHGGRITVSSDEKITVFEGLIPKPV